MFAYHAFSLQFLKFLTPLYLLCIPYLLRGSVKVRFSVRDVLIGVAASIVILLPFLVLLLLSGGKFGHVSLSLVMFHFILVSLPEEIYFRGYLQEVLGNNLSSVLLVSFLFALTHLPQLIFYGDFLSVLTFFPSLVMGALYLMTSNVVPSIIFHGAANILFLGMNSLIFASLP